MVALLCARMRSDRRRAPVVSELRCHIQETILVSIQRYEDEVRRTSPKVQKMCGRNHGSPSGQVSGLARLREAKVRFLQVSVFPQKTKPGHALQPGHGCGRAAPRGPRWLFHVLFVPLPRHRPAGLAAEPQQERQSAKLVSRLCGSTWCPAAVSVAAAAAASVSAGDGGSSDRGAGWAPPSSLTHSRRDAVTRAYSCGAPPPGLASRVLCVAGAFCGRVRSRAACHPHSRALALAARGSRACAA